MAVVSEDKRLASASKFCGADEVKGVQSTNMPATKYLDPPPQDGGAENDTCGICTDVVHSRGVLDCCTHLFCFTCINDWSTVTNLCPLCKARFRFITCLPVSFSVPNSWGDSQQSSFELVKRDAASTDESALPFSFPSYFIDEEAVVCLEGDGCRVRAGLLPLDDAGMAATETSVACDLCDCWYHAECVNFDPQQSSFYCPRCTSQDRIESSKSAGISPPEDKAGPFMGPVPMGKEITYGEGMMFGSDSVAIAVADEGESAVSISMRRVPDGHHAKVQALSPDLLQNRGEIWSPIREPVNMSSSYGVMWSPIREPLGNLYQQSHAELWSPTREPLSNLEQHCHHSSWSPSIEPRNDLSETSVKEQDNVLDLAATKSSLQFSSKKTLGSEILGPLTSTVNPPGSELRRSSAISIHKISDIKEIDQEAVPVSTTEELTESTSVIEDDILIDVGRLQVAVEQLRKGKRKVLQEDERNIDFKDLPEPPRKVSRNATRRINASDVKTLAGDKDMVKRGSANENGLVSADGHHGQSVSNSIVSRDTSERVPNLMSTKEHLDASLIEVVNNAGKGKSMSLEVKSEVNGTNEESQSDRGEVKSEGHDSNNAAETDNSKIVDVANVDDDKIIGVEAKKDVDVMDIVSDPHNKLVKLDTGRPCAQKGVRARIIIHREADVKDTGGPTLVERIRQQMRDSAGYGAGEDLGKVEVSDDRFIAAFKAALTRSHERSKDAKSATSRQQKSWWLSKVLNRNLEGKGAREKLTRKLYAGGTGRWRWDRDWDIAFWKERAAHMRRAQKQAEEEVDCRGKLVKEGELVDTEPDPEDNDGFFSRLYVADTSLFPRDDNVLPLSAQVKHGEVNGASEPNKMKSGKVPQLELEKCRPQQVPSDDTKSSHVHGLSVKTFGAESFSYTLDLPRTDKALIPPPTLGDGFSGATHSGKNADRVAESVAPSKEKGTTSSVTAQSSCAKVTKSGQVGNPVRQTQNKEAETKGEAKKDKRQWALEVLARKTGNLRNVSAASNEPPASKDNQFFHLLQLPVEMRPLLPHNRRSKVPTAIRQVQLNRIVEQELRRAKVLVIGSNSECGEAVARAVSREEELYKSCNSKGVYVNLCVRALAQAHAPSRVHEESDPECSERIQRALEATGLLDSPPPSPVHIEDESALKPNEEDRVVGVGKEGSLEGSSSEKKWAENVLDMDSSAALDIYGDFEFNSDDTLDATLLAENLESCKLEPPTWASRSESKTNKVTIVLATGRCQADDLKSGKAESLVCNPTIERVQEGASSFVKKDTILETNDLPPPEVKVPGVGMVSIVDDADDMYSGLEMELSSIPVCEVIAVENPVHSNPSTCPQPSPQSSVGEDNIGLTTRNTSSKASDNLKVSKRESNIEGAETLVPGENSSIDDWMSNGNFADIDRRIENIRRSSSNPVSEHYDVVAKKSKSADQGGAKLVSEHQQGVQPVRMQVEIYVNQHLKPLYRSGVITSEQFSWAVSKTAAKVMEHHENAVTADFLITEGSKVRKLADQYLQAFARRKNR